MNIILSRGKKSHSLLNILYGENNNYFELLKITSDSNNSYYKPKENLNNLKILSNINSLFSLSNSNLFFSYFTRDNDTYYLKVLKGTINIFSSNSFNIAYNDTQFISNNHYYFNSTNCFETTNYINCLNLGKRLVKYYLKILIFNKKDGEEDLCEKDCFLDDSKVYLQSNIFRKGIFLRDEISAYIFFFKFRSKAKTNNSKI